MPIFMATILACLCFPAFHWVNMRLSGHANLAALVTCLAVTALIIVPFAGLAIMLASEAALAYQQLQTAVEQGKIREMMSLREQPFIDAARAIGARPIRILITHIFPNIVPSLVVMGTFGCAAAMLSEAGLSFLGAGVPPDNPSWGNVMAESRGYFHKAVWVIFYPGLMLAIFVTALNVAGDTLRDILDPRLRRNLE